MSTEEFGLDYFEMLLYEGFSLCLVVKEGFSISYEIDSLVLREFCKVKGLDFLWCVGLYKAMSSEIKKE